MPKVITRTGKGSLISLSEDNDHKEATAGKVTTTATALTAGITHQNDTIEVTGNVTITLDLISNIASSLHTNNYSVTIIALHASGCTVTCSGSDAFNDGTTSVTLSKDNVIHLQTSSASLDWLVISNSNASKLSGLTSSQFLRSDIADSSQGVVDFVNSIKFAGTLITRSATDINNLATQDDLSDVAGGGVFIVDGSITTQKIANDAVTREKIAAEAVGSLEIEPDAIQSSHYADDSVLSQHIKDGDINSTHYAANSVGASVLTNSSVSSSALQSNSVTSAKIAGSAVVEAAIASNAVTTSKIATNGVATTNITDGAVTAAKLSSTAVEDEIKGMSVGAIGTYAMLKHNIATDVAAGATALGSNLSYSNANATTSGTPAGTWRCMGFSDNVSSVAQVTMWLRIS